MCSPCGPGASLPGEDVCTVTVANPSLNSMVAAATCEPSGALICAVNAFAGATGAGADGAGPWLWTDVSGAGDPVQIAGGV